MCTDEMTREEAFVFIFSRFSSPGNVVVAQDGTTMFRFHHGHVEVSTAALPYWQISEMPEGVYITHDVWVSLGARRRRGTPLAQELMNGFIRRPDAEALAEEE